MPNNPNNRGVRDWLVRNDGVPCTCGTCQRAHNRYEEQYGTESVREQDRIEAERLRTRVINDEEILRGIRTPENETNINPSYPFTNMPNNPQTSYTAEDFTFNNAGSSTVTNRWIDPSEVLKQKVKPEPIKSKTNPRGKTAKLKLNVNLELTKEKYGLRIKVESDNLGSVVQKFFKIYRDKCNNGSRTTKMYNLNNSLVFLDNWNSNMLITKPNINMDLLRYMEKDKEIEFIVKNVFTNKEIRQYIKMFGEYMKDLQEFVQKA